MSTAPASATLPPSREDLLTALRRSTGGQGQVDEAPIHIQHGRG